LLKVLLISALLYQPFIALADAENSDPKATPAFADAKIMGKCSGLYNFMAVLYQTQRNKSNVQGAIEESDSWRAATNGALYEAGFDKVKVTIISDSLIEEERERLMTLMKSTPKYVTEDIDTSLKTCGEHMQAYEHYRNKMEAINQTK